MRKLIGRAKDEGGQSLVEMGVIIPFLAILLLAATEMAWAFTTYTTLISAARVGAGYASLYPETRNCTQADWSDTSNIPCFTYSERVKDEVLAIGILGTDETLLRIFPPTMYSPDGSTVYANCPITSTLSYTLTTFSSGMSLPLVGRMGLPNYYTIRYSIGAPIRQAEDQHPDCLSYSP